MARQARQGASGGVVFLLMLALRLGFTAIAAATMVWLLASGRPLGGLVIVPLVAIWLRRTAESGRFHRLGARFRVP